MGLPRLVLTQQGIVYQVTLGDPLILPPARPLPNQYNCELGETAMRKSLAIPIIFLLPSVFLSSLTERCCNIITVYSKLGGSSSSLKDTMFKKIGYQNNKLLFENKNGEFRLYYRTATLNWVVNEVSSNTVVMLSNTDSKSACPNDTTVWYRWNINAYSKDSSIAAICTKETKITTATTTITPTTKVIKNTKKNLVSQPQPVNDPVNPNGKNAVPLIAGAACGGLLLTIGGIVLGVWLYRKRQRASEAEEMEMNKDINDIYGTYGECGEGDYNIVEDNNPYYEAGD